MSARGAVWVGADPGGKGNFGVAILTADDRVHTVSVDCADEAFAFVCEHTHHPPAGVGVDAPLWWSSGRSGDRHADRWLRHRYGLSGGEVQAANSLRGAALVQGAMFVHLLREAFPEVAVTESHPKALLKAVAGNSWKVFSARFGVTFTAPNEHARDAVVAAVAAREAFEGRWTHDLGDARVPGEQDPMNCWLAPVHYFWPET
jgi:predicted nuclease with RNAse H fold